MTLFLLIDIRFIDRMTKIAYLKFW